MIVYVNGKGAKTWTDFLKTNHVLKKTVVARFAAIVLLHVLCFTWYMTISSKKH